MNRSSVDGAERGFVASTRRVRFVVPLDHRDAGARNLPRPSWLAAASPPRKARFCRCC